jgi:hypothetical protein
MIPSTNPSKSPIFSLPQATLSACRIGPSSWHKSPPRAGAPERRRPPTLDENTSGREEPRGRQRGASSRSCSGSTFVGMMDCSQSFALIDGIDSGRVALDASPLCI